MFFFYNIYFAELKTNYCVLIKLLKHNWRALLKAEENNMMKLLIK